MNPNRPLYARITLNNSKKSLGKAPTLNEFLRRAAVEYTTHKYNGEKFIGLIEFSYEPLPSDTIMSREQQLLHEFANIPLTPDDEEIYPGITMGRAMEIMNSEIGIRYNEIRNPDKRVGLDNEIIKEVRLDFHNAYGIDGQTVLPWIES